jgi:outer membrane protein assembly factor BamB
VYQGRLYLTTAVPLADDESSDQSLRALCLDAESGNTLWDVEVFFQAAGGSGSIHAKNSHASPTPLTDGERLYVHFGPNGTAALDLTGGLLWANRDIRYDARHGGAGSPILSGRRLVFNCDGVVRPFVVALDRETGKELWRTHRPEIQTERFSFATPLEIEVDGEKQIVSPGSSIVCGYAAKTGREIWYVTYPNKWSVIPRPTYAHGLVFICTGYEGPAELLAIRPDGTGDITETNVVWRTKENVPHTPSPLIVGNEIFLVSDTGVASCRDARTGRLHWRKRLGGNYSASPINAGGRIYIPSEEGECVVLAADTEFRELARNDLGERTLASYAVYGETLFVRTAAHLFRIEAGSPAVP